MDMDGSPFPGHDHPPVPPDTKILDPWVYLGHIAGRTTRLRLGTFVYNLGLRHPFVSARSIMTADYISNGRVEIGVGASWLESEWRAVGWEFGSRGRRLDEALDVCTRLWHEREVEHHGEFYDFGPVMFEPKPVQQPHPPIHIGGVSDVALRRAVRLGDGWIGMNTTIDEVAHPIARLRELEQEYGRARTRPFEVTVGGAVRERADIERWAEAGVTRLIFGQLGPSREAVDNLRRLADKVLA
jgi:probable F420-dependent oxidoreductase